MEYRLLDTRPAPWEPWHCILVYKVRNSAEGGFQSKLWLAQFAAMAPDPDHVADLTPGYTPGHLMTVPPGRTWEGEVSRAVDELADGGEARRGARGDRRRKQRVGRFGRTHAGPGCPSWPAIPTGRWTLRTCTTRCTSPALSSR